MTSADLGAHGHFPNDAVIDGPGENGNRDNEWDIMEGAYLQLDGSGSTDENPSTAYALFVSVDPGKARFPGGLRT